MDHSEPSSSGMNGAVPKTKKRKSDGVKLSSSQRSINWRQQQKELDPEGFRERERLRTRERRKNRQRNQTANQTKCSTNMSSEETQTDITVSVNEILWKLTPLFDSSGRYKFVDQMDGTGNVNLIFEENDKAVMNTSHLAAMSPLSLPSGISDIPDIDLDEYSKILPIISSKKTHATFDEEYKASKICTKTISEFQTPVETVVRSIENNPANGNPGDVDDNSKLFDDIEIASSPKIHSVRDTSTSTDPCPDVGKRGKKQTISLSDGNSIESSNSYQNIFQTIDCNQLPTGPSDKHLMNSDSAEQEIPILTPLSVTSLILDMEQDLTKTIPQPYSVKSVCSEAERPSSKKILVTSNDDIAGCTGGDIQLNEGIKSDTDTISEFQMPVETVGSSNEYSPPAGIPIDVDDISKQFADMGTTSSSQTPSFRDSRKSTDYCREVDTKVSKRHGERNTADRSNDEEHKQYSRKGEFCFYGNAESYVRRDRGDERDFSIGQLLLCQDKIYVKKDQLGSIEEVTDTGEVGEAICLSRRDGFVNHVSFSPTTSTIWFCCDDNSVRKYVNAKTEVIFRTRFPPKSLYIDSSNFKENVYVCLEDGIEMWDANGTKIGRILINFLIVDAHSVERNFEPTSVHKDDSTGRLLVIDCEHRSAVVLNESFQQSLITPPRSADSYFRILCGCFDHAGNIILGTWSGVCVFSGVDLTVMQTIKESFINTLVCLPDHRLFFSVHNIIHIYSDNED